VEVFATGDGTSEILGVRILSDQGEPLSLISSGESITVRVRLLPPFHQPKSDPMVGILIRTAHRHGCLRHQHEYRARLPLGDFQAGRRNSKSTFHIECWLAPQTYNSDGRHAKMPTVPATTGLTMRFAFDVMDAPLWSRGVANLRAKVEWRVFTVKVHSAR